MNDDEVRDLSKYLCQKVTMIIIVLYRGYEGIIRSTKQWFIKLLTDSCNVAWHDDVHDKKINKFCWVLTIAGHSDCEQEEKDYACSQALVPLILVRALLSYTKPIAISGVLPLGLYWTRDLKLKLKYLCKSPANSNQFKSNCSTWQINSQISSQIRQISKEGFVSNIRITKYSNL